MPLQRRTPLRASGSLERRSLRPRSDKRAKLYAEERRPLVVRLLADRPRCEVRVANCTFWSTEVHEIKTRARGGSITDERNCLTACHSCHSWVTAHPDAARRLGFVMHSWEPDA